MTPPAPDPVSTAVTETLQARCTAIAGYSNFAQVIAQARGSMLASSANTYDEQEQLNAASLGSVGGQRRRFDQPAASCVEPDYSDRPDRYRAPAQRTPDQRQRHRKAAPWRPGPRRAL